MPKPVNNHFSNICFPQFLKNCARLHTAVVNLQIRFVVKLYNMPIHCQKCCSYNIRPRPYKIESSFSPTKPTNLNLVQPAPTYHATRPSCTTGWIVYGPFDWSQPTITM